MMYSLKFTVKILILLLITCFSNRYCEGQNRGEIYVDKTHQPHVKSVQLYPVTNLAGQEMISPIISLRQATQLLLQFDLLEQNYRLLQARIIHCNSDWTRSVLSDIEILNEYNAMDIREFDYSFNTKRAYVNYWFYLPKVKISGNYVIQVYQNNNPKEILLTRRFVIFENLVSINPRLLVSSKIMERRTNQQIDFTVEHGRIRVSNPMSEFKVTIRQNQRWDNAISKLKPTFSNRARALLEYHPFDGSNNFKGGNEFRFVDLRTYTFRGRYVANIDRSVNPTRVDVLLDQSRNGQSYSMLHDMNGGYVIQTMETGARYLEADYLHVKFSLKTEASLEPMYLLGAFNFWTKDENSQMQFDPNTGTYFKSVLLKQGLYDYQYWVDGYSPLMHEGSFYETRNQYEIIVYHRSFTDLADRVVGYYTFVTDL